MFEEPTRRPHIANGCCSISGFGRATRVQPRNQKKQSRLRRTSPLFETPCCDPADRRHRKNSICRVGIEVLAQRPFKCVETGTARLRRDRERHGVAAETGPVYLPCARKFRLMQFAIQKCFSVSVAAITGADANIIRAVRRHQRFIVFNLRSISRILRFAIAVCSNQRDPAVWFENAETSTKAHQSAAPPVESRILKSRTGCPPTVTVTRLMAAPFCTGRFSRLLVRNSVRSEEGRGTSENKI